MTDSSNPCLPSPLVSVRGLARFPTAWTLALALAACAKTSAPVPRVIEVGVVTLSPQSVSLTTQLTGRAAATMTAEVRPQVTGILHARLFEEGSAVHSGQPLYEIDPRPYRAALNQARAQLDNAQAMLVTAQAKADRYRNLTDVQAVSHQDIDDVIAAAQQARANVQQFRAATETAQLNLEYTRVLAPITGRIGRSSITPGALLTAGQSAVLATIQSLDPIYVDITQSTQALLQLRRALARGSVLPTNTEVHLLLEDGTPYSHAGTLEFTEVTVNENADTVMLRARFPNPDSLLLPGMFVRVETPQGRVPNAFLAPQQGITRDARGNAVAWVVDTSNKVIQRNVTAAKAIGNQWLITDGFEAGDRLIVEGLAKIAPGQTVKPTAISLKY